VERKESDVIPECRDRQRHILKDGDVRDYWLCDCQLLLGPSCQLARLAQSIENIGKEESRGNDFHLGSLGPANTCAADSPSPPLEEWNSLLGRLMSLRGLLWVKEVSLRVTFFSAFQHPSWNSDTNPHINGDMRSAVKLWLLSDTSSGAQLQGDRFLPCGANKLELLVRGAYEEMYNILLRVQEDWLEHIRKSAPTPHWKTICLMLGQTGIGKTWFLSYILVWRLLEGKPTIFQFAKRFNGTADTETIHYLTNGNGACLVSSLSASLFRDPGVWVLADQKPVGAP